MSDPVTRQRMLEGDWDVEVEGTRFNRRWFTPIDAVAGGAIRSARHWDLAATEVGPAARNPDYTVGTLVHRYPSARYVVADVVRGRWSSAKVEAIMRATAATDGRGVMVGVEQEPGSAGKAMVSHVKRNVLAGYNVQGMLPTGDKFTRAGPVASAAEDGRIDVLRAPWLPAWLSELGLFSERYKGHDDQVDSLSGAFELVHRAGRTTTRRTRAQLPGSMARQVA